MIEALILHSNEDTEKARAVASTLGLQNRYALLPVEALTDSLKVSPTTMRIVVWTKPIPDSRDYLQSIEPFLANSPGLLLIQYDDTPLPVAIQGRSHVVSSNLSADEMAKSFADVRAQTEASPGLEAQRLSPGKRDSLIFGWFIAFGVGLIAASVAAYLTQEYWLPLLKRS